MAPNKRAGKALSTLDRALDRFVGSLDDKDRRAAIDRVAELRRKHPQADAHELVRQLIRRKCRRTAVIGAVTAAPSVVPGLGTVTSLVLGTSVDLALTAGLQAELVLEVAAVFEVSMTPAEERAAILAIVGLGLGANQLLEVTGRKLAARASERLAGKAVARSLPLIGMGAAAGTNAATTYAIGRRAIGYFALGPDRMEDWGEALRAVSGVDERALVGWMSEAAEGTRALVGDGVRGAGNQVITIAGATGDLILSGASRATSGLKKATSFLRARVASFGKTRGQEEPRAKVTEIPPPPLPPPADAEEEKNFDS